MQAETSGSSRPAIRHPGSITETSLPRRRKIWADLQPDVAAAQDHEVGRPFAQRKQRDVVQRGHVRQGRESAG